MGLTYPVIEIIDESAGEWIYALRIRSQRFQPKVFRKGTYTIHIGEGSGHQTLRGVPAERLDEKVIRHVVFPVQR